MPPPMQNPRLPASLCSLLRPEGARRGAALSAEQLGCRGWGMGAQRLHRMALKPLRCSGVLGRAALRGDAGLRWPWHTRVAHGLGTSRTQARHEGLREPRGPGTPRTPSHAPPSPSGRHALSAGVEAQSQQGGLRAFRGGHRAVGRQERRCVHLLSSSCNGRGCAAAPACGGGSP